MKDSQILNVANRMFIHLRPNDILTCEKTVPACFVFILFRCIPVHPVNCEVFSIITCDLVLVLLDT